MTTSANTALISHLRGYYGRFLQFVHVKFNTLFSTHWKSYCCASLEYYKKVKLNINQ